MGTLSEPGMAPAACSSAVRTSISGQPWATRPSSSSRVDDVAVAAQHVLGHVPEQVDRVLGRGERRSIGELQVSQVIGGHASCHRGGDHVDALVDTVAADDLSAEDRPVVGVENELCRHAGGAGVVGGVVEGVGVDRAERPPGRSQTPLVPPTVAATTSKTLTMAVPREGTGLVDRPAMWSATRRPWRLATLAKAMSEVAWEIASGFSTASPTA